MGGSLASFTVAPANTSPFCVVTVPFREVSGTVCGLGRLLGKRETGRCEKEKCGRQWQEPLPVHPQKTAAVCAGKQRRATTTWELIHYWTHISLHDEPTHAHVYSMRGTKVSWLKPNREAVTLYASPLDSVFGGSNPCPTSPQPAKCGILTRQQVQFPCMVVGAPQGFLNLPEAP